jgi:hypothetical protein
VALEFDVEKVDQYGRLLAYLWLPDHSMFNEALVDEGLAQVATFPPNVGSTVQPFTGPVRPFTPTKNRGVGDDERNTACTCDPREWKTVSGCSRCRSAPFAPRIISSRIATS